MAKTTDPKTVTIRGRLSFPRFTLTEAIEANKKSAFPKGNEADVKAEFNLLIEDAQLEKLKQHIAEVFLPYVEAQYAKGPKEKDALDPKVVKKIRDKLASDDWEGAPFLPVKAVSEKNQEAAPEAVATVKANGSKGRDIEVKASVYSEDQLLVPEPDILSYPVMRPIKQTVFQPYAGAYFAATLNLYAFFSSASVNGISAGANVAVYMGNLDGERFGGGVDIDESEIFLDD